MVNLDDVLNGSKTFFLRSCRHFDLRHDDFVWQGAGAVLQMPQAHFSWQTRYFVDLNFKKSARNLPKTLFFRFKMFICRGARSLTRLNSNMCSLNPLVTLCRPDCSHCGAVRILCYRSRNDFGTSIARVRSLSAWRRANFDITGATFSALCACQSALAAARCSF